jgi:hypothetical protein
LQTKVKLRERTLLVRVNRLLAKDGMVLKKSKGVEAISSVGQFYLLNSKTGQIVETKIDLEKFGRKKGVFKPWEQIDG